MAHWVGASVEGELGCLGSLESGEGEAEDGHGFEGKLSRDMLLTNPDEAKQFVAETKVDALAGRDRHQPRRLQVHPQADRRNPGDGCDRGDP